MSNHDTSTLFIGEETQYFLDNAIVEVADNVTRTIHHPTPIDQNPLIQRDKPWEHVTYFSCNSWNLRRDRETGQFHCFYTDFKLDRERLVARGGSSHGWENARLRQLYARSDDGIAWVKPAMGIQQENGHDTNIVFGTEDYGSVYDIFIVDDPLESNPERRFKTLYSLIEPVAENESRFSVHAAYSADGIHLTPYEEAPSFGKLGSVRGDVTIAAFDPVSQTHLIATRHPWQYAAPDRIRLRPDQRSHPMVGGEPVFDAVVGHANRRGKRRVFLAESRDFMHWTTPQLILAPDPDIDNFDDAFYGMTPYRIGGQWIGFLNVFHMVSNTMDVQLVHSRDGRFWNRVAPGQPWLQRGKPGSWNQFMVTIPSPPVAVGDELWVYFGGSRNHHDWWFSGGNEAVADPEVWSDVAEVWDWNAVGYGLGLAKLRRDGFVSIGANSVRQGLLATQPFISPGNRLIINAVCGKNGYVKVEFTDEVGTVIPGRSHRECDPFDGDAVGHVVTWNGQSTLDGPPGTETSERPPFRRLRFLMRDTELFSFRIARR